MEESLAGSKFDVAEAGVTYNLTVLKFEAPKDGKCKAQVDIAGCGEEVIELHLDPACRPVRAQGGDWKGEVLNYEPNQTNRILNIRAWRVEDGLNMVLDDAAATGQFRPWHGNLEQEDDLIPVAGFPCDFGLSRVVDCLDLCLHESLQKYSKLGNNCHDFCSDFLVQLREQGAINARPEFEDGSVDRYKRQ